MRFCNQAVMNRNFDEERISRTLWIPYHGKIWHYQDLGKETVCITGSKTAGSKTPFWLENLTNQSIQNQIRKIVNHMNHGLKPREREK